MNRLNIEFRIFTCLQSDVKGPRIIICGLCLIYIEIECVCVSLSIIVYQVNCNKRYFSI